MLERLKGSSLESTRKLLEGGCHEPNVADEVRYFATRVLENRILASSHQIFEYVERMKRFLGCQSRDNNELLVLVFEFSELVRVEPLIDG